MFPGFDAACILIAGLLAINSVERYRYIAGAVFFEFAIHQVIYQFGVLETKLLDNFSLYIFYAISQMIVMYYLYIVKSHLIIAALIFINMIYNLLTSLAYFNDSLVPFYYAAPYCIGAIMLLELTYLGVLSRYVFALKSKYGSVNYEYIDRVFRVRHGRSDRDLA